MEQLEADKLIKILKDGALKEEQERLALEAVVEERLRSFSTAEQQKAFEKQFQEAVIISFLNNIIKDLMTPGLYELYKKCDPRIKNHSIENGKTALMWAADAAQNRMVNFLIGERARVNQRDKEGNTPLMWAAHGGNKEIAKKLIDSKAKINAFNLKKETALMWAASTGRLNIVQLLLDEGADINARDASGQTALVKAAGHEEVFNFLQNFIKNSGKESLGKKIIDSVRSHLPHSEKTEVIHKI